MIADLSHDIQAADCKVVAYAEDLLVLFFGNTKLFIGRTVTDLLEGPKLNDKKVFIEEPLS